MRIIKLNENTKKDILNDLLKRSPNNYDSYSDKVNVIVNDVKDKGDEAVFSYTKQFDGADLDASNILVTEEEIAEAYAELEKTGLVDIIRKALVNMLLLPPWSDFRFECPENKNPIGSDQAFRSCRDSY